MRLEIQQDHAPEADEDAHHPERGELVGLLAVDRGRPSAAIQPAVALTSSSANKTAGRADRAAAPSSPRRATA